MKGGDGDGLARGNTFMTGRCEATRLYNGRMLGGAAYSRRIRGNAV